MKTKLISLKGRGTKIFEADESFWDNIRYLVFHSEHLEIQLKRGRPAHYLHSWFYHQLRDARQGYTEPERQSIYQELSCSYRFPEENQEVLDYLYTEASNRGLLRNHWQEEIHNISS